MEEKSLKSTMSQTRPLVDKLVELYKSQLYQGDHNASGKLSNFQTDIQFDGSRYRVYFLLEPYWRYLEYGRKPGKFPPPDAIREWVYIKQLIPSASKEAPKVKQVAYLISKKIAKSGTPANKPLQKALSSPEASNIITQIKNTIIKNIKDEINDELKHIFK